MDKPLKLYERIRQLPKIIGIDGKEFSERLGVNYSTYTGYLNPRREHNLWPLLPQILERWPEISRQWLYFGEGPASFGRPYAQAGRPVGIRRLIGFAEQMAEDCDGDWLEVLRVIIGRAKEQVEDNPGSSEKIDKLNAELEAERAYYRKEIDDLKKQLATALEIADGLTKKFVSGGGNAPTAPDTAKVAGGRG